MAPINRSVVHKSDGVPKILSSGPRVSAQGGLWCGAEMVLGSGRGCTIAAAALQLDGWAPDRTIRTEDTAVTGLGPEQRVTALALVKVHARIDRHGLGGPKPAIRASKHGLEERGGLHRVAVDVAGSQDLGSSRR